MADDPQVDIEVALKDSTSSVLKEISKEIDLVTRKMVEAGIKGTEAFNSITRHSRGGREEIEKTNVSLSSMGKTMFEMGKAMLGPAGLAAGFVAVSKAMTNFAQQRQQLQMLSTDVGFTAERLKLMARVAERMGMDPTQSKAFAQQLGGQLKELATLKMDSPLFQNLTRMGESNFAKDLLKTVEAQDFDKAMDMIVAKFEEMGRKNKDAQEYFARDVLGINVSILKEWTETSAGIVVVQQKSLAETKKYLANVETVHNALNTAMGVTFDVIYTGMEKTNKKYEEFSNIIKPLLSSSVPSDVQNVSPEVTNPAIRELRGLPILKEGPQAPEKRAAGGPAYSGRSYVVGERGPELFTPNQSGTVVASLSNAQPQLREMVDTEKESNKALDDILTTLKEMQGPPGGQGGAMGFGGLGTGGAPSSGSGSGTGAPGPASLPLQVGDIPGSGGGHGGRFNVPAGTKPIGADQSEVVTLANGQRVTVNKRAAAQFQGFFNDLIKVGAPVHSLGGVGFRGGNPSQHPAGLAIDWAQLGRGQVSPDVARWMRENQAVLDVLEQKWGMSGGEHWKVDDRGHFSIDTLFGTEHLAQLGIKAGALAAGDVTGTPITAGRGGRVDPTALNARLRELIKQSGLEGFIPPDAAKYGFRTGSAKEWAGLLSGIAGWESGNKTTSVGDVANFTGGSRGLFQLSRDDAITYGIRSTPFTDAELADPDFNARMAVLIAAKKARAGGVAGPGGMADYWAGHGKASSFLADAKVKADTDTQAQIEARRKLDEASKSAINMRTGKVSATVDFGDLAKKEEAKMPFFKLKQGVEPQNQSVRESQVVPGDSGHSDWVP